MGKPWHTVSVPDVLVQLSSNDTGLTETEAAIRLNGVGTTELKGKNISLSWLFLLRNSKRS
jgi:hypothetical protein